MAQALWNGFLRVSLVSCPVSLAPAVIAGKRIRLDEVNAGTGNPVTEQFVDAKTGNVVPSGALAKAYRVDEGKFVIISGDELQGVASSPANVLDIEQFVRKGQVDRIYFEAVCYIDPEGELAADTVQALRLAMERNGRVGIGRVSLGGRERAVMVEPHGAGLMLTTLHSPDEIEPPAFAERAADRIPGEMVEVAETIIGRRSRDFAPDLLTDRADAALRALLEKKTGAAAPATAKPAPKPASEPPKPAPVAAPAPPPTVAPTPPPAPQPPKPPPPAPPAVAAPAPPPASDPAPAPPPPAPAPALVVAPVPPAVVAPVPPPPRPTLAVVPPSEPAPDREPTVPPRPEAAAELSPAAADLAALDPGADTVTAGAGNGADGAEKTASAEGSPRELGAEVLLHIMGLGDRRYVEMGWAGNPGSRRQIEALSIRPREVLPASAVEFRVFAQEGRATAWVSNGNYAGTRGRGLPLTGFAVRPAPNLSDRLEIVYEGSFFEGGTVGPKRDGELCISPVADDPLEAVRVSIVERAPD